MQKAVHNSLLCLFSGLWLCLLEGGAGAMTDLSIFFVSLPGDLVQRNQGGEGTKQDERWDPALCEPL